jgi:hypothetical protein
MHKNKLTQPMAAGSPQPQRTRVKTDAAAKYLGVSASKLTKLRVYGGGPRYYKLSKSVVYDLSDLDVWLSGHAQTSTSQNAA